MHSDKVKSIEKKNIRHTFLVTKLTCQFEIYIYIYIYIRHTFLIPRGYFTDKNLKAWKQ